MEAALQYGSQPYNILLWIKSTNALKREKAPKLRNCSPCIFRKAITFFQYINSGNSRFPEKGREEEGFIVTVSKKEPVLSAIILKYIRVFPVVANKVHEIRKIQEFSR